MALATVITSVCVVSLCSLLVGAGLVHLARLDRRRMEYDRQSACQWHHWRALEDGSWLVCGLCGKRTRRLNPPPDRDLGTISSDSILP